MMCATVLVSMGLSCSAATHAQPTADEWASIRSAYEAAGHSAIPVDGGHLAGNPAQQWTTLFDGRGFTTTPDAGGWSWGLELSSYGWGADESAVRLPRSVTAASGRVAYPWDDRLTEWYVNDSRGLEHGYTVLTRPADACGTLSLRLAIRGDLTPVFSGSGRDVRFADATGSAVLNYSGLAVLDADGRALAASWRSLSEGMQLSVEDQDARYPLTIDPIAQQAYLKASNTGQDDHFGCSVSASGDTVVIGAYNEDSNATGVDGNGNIEGTHDSGAAYVFVRNGTRWRQQAYLKASNTGSDDHFGTTVSVSGDTVVVGAPDEDSTATGVDGDGSLNFASFSGAAYVFVRNGTSWSQQAYLKASNTGAGDQFGMSVSVSGDTIVVGARGEGSNATGVNGDQSDNSAGGSGAAYVFVRSGTTWSQEAYLKASNCETTDVFGSSVSVSGDTVVVGAWAEDSNATGVNGDESDNSLFQPGAAYVFVRSGTSWSQQAYLKASNTEAIDMFGKTVSISGDTILVAAPREDSNATGVNGDQSNNSASEAGAVYAFVRSGTSWSQEAYLKASNPGSFRDFGLDVSISGDTAVIGEPGDNSGATGVNGSQVDDSLFEWSGAAFVFVHSGSSWSQQAYLKASNTGEDDVFGGAVSVSGSTVVVGASEEDSSHTGVNGNQTNNDCEDAGAAYVFDLETPFVPICFPGTGSVLACPCGQPANLSGGCRNFGATATSGAVLNALGTPSLAGDTIVLETTNHRTAPPAGILNVFFTGQGAPSNGVASHAGVRCVNANLKRLYYGNTTAGVLSLPRAGDPSVSARSAALGVAIAPGDTRHYFNVYRDPVASIGCANSTWVSNLTNAGSITWAP